MDTMKIRVDPIDRAAWEAAASACGLTLSAWLRQVATLAAQRGDDPAALVAEISAIRGELRAIGVNCNQIARSANQGNDVGLSIVMAKFGTALEARDRELAALLARGRS